MYWEVAILVQVSHTFWQTLKIINSSSRPGNVLEVSKVAKCPGNILKKNLKQKSLQINIMPVEEYIYIYI